MGKNKLRKFAEMQNFQCVFQYPFGRLAAEGFPMRGRWHADFFGNDHPIVLELGCGKGEYTVGLARRFPERNFIGIDIKGARIYTGAREACNSGMTNVAFLRTDIELLERFFAPGEVSEIWITFPDPQMKKTRKRLTATAFLRRYRAVCGPQARINLKTDSPFLYEFTRRLTELNALKVEENCPDLYGSQSENLPPYLREIRTFYEQQWLSRGKKIKYLSFRLPSPDGEIFDPDEDDIPRDDYRSFSRGVARDSHLQAADPPASAPAALASASSSPDPDPDPSPDPLL